VRARDHETAFYPRQISCQILGDPVREILLLPLVTQICERQHDDRLEAVAVEHRQGRLAVIGDGDLVAGDLEDAPQDLAIGVVVLGDQDLERAGGRRQRRARRRRRRFVRQRLDQLGHRLGVAGQRRQQRAGEGGVADRRLDHRGEMGGGEPGDRFGAARRGDEQRERWVRRGDRKAVGEAQGGEGVGAPVEEQQRSRRRRGHLTEALQRRFGVAQPLWLAAPAT